MSLLISVKTKTKSSEIKKDICEIFLCSEVASDLMGFVINGELKKLRMEEKR